MYKPATSGRESKSSVEESSGAYDDDFESLSKSKNELNALLGDPKKPAAKPLPTITKPIAALATVKQSLSPITANTSSVVASYVRKENKQTMTDLGKYSFMSNAVDSANLSEWALKKNLDDAELMIQELKVREAEQTENIRSLELKLKTKEMEF